MPIKTSRLAEKFICIQNQNTYLGISFRGKKCSNLCLGVDNYFNKFSPVLKRIIARRQANS